MTRRTLFAAVISVSSFMGASVAQGQSPQDASWYFVADPDFGMETGVRTTASLGRFMFLYDAELSRSIDLDESTVAGKALGMTGRALKTFFIDAPLVELQELINHEVFGHGARGREAGLEPSYVFRLIPPYRWFWSGEQSDDTGYTAMTLNTWADQLDRDSATNLGGIEANVWSTWWVNLDMVRRDGWMHYRDMLNYGIKAAWLTVLLDDYETLPSDEKEVDDTDDYVSYLQDRFNRWRPQGRRAIARSLKRAIWWNFVDSTLWLSAYHGLVTYWYKGERYAKLPFISLWKLRLYPSTRFNLSPFGAEHYLDLFGRYNNLTFDVYGRAGSSGLAAYWGGGLRLFGFEPGSGVSLGGELDFWRQPEILFKHRNVFEREEQFGGNLGLHLEWKLHGRFGLAGKLAWKTKGYLMGQPQARGVHGYVGLFVAPNTEGALLTD